jgi:hypothetical protein
MLFVSAKSRGKPKKVFLAFSSAVRPDIRIAIPGIVIRIQVREPRIRAIRQIPTDPRDPPGPARTHHIWVCRKSYYFF